MADPGSVPATPDESSENILGSPGSPGSLASSTASTPLEAPPDVSELQSPDEPREPQRRMPSLRAVPDNTAAPGSMISSSTHVGVLNNARRPPVRPAATAMSSGNVSAIADKMRAFALSRQQGTPSASPISPTTKGPPTASGSLPGGIPLGAVGSLPGGVPSSFSAAPRPAGPSPNVKSEPVIPKNRLAAKRGFAGSLSGMMGAASPTPPAASGSQPPPPQQNGGMNKMDEFKKYIDSEKGYLTFEGKAIITNEGVDFSDGSVFRISLDQVVKIEELGKGNYGVVYKVKHTKKRIHRFAPGLADSKAVGADAVDADGKLMAMKEIRLELDEAKLATILKELIILHECVSPYIIDFYGAFFQESAVYMCIEYMDGGSIDKLYKGGIPENVLRKITRCTILGLKELKEKHNIIHRDVKPTNILVNTQGQVKICDFGVSGNLVASIAKTNIGCQSYMAPERISGGAFMQSGASDGTYSVQSDIWSLGLTIIECAMGKYPYPPEISSTIFSQLSAIVEGDPPDLPEEGYSDVARSFVNGCLNKSPKLRPSYSALLGSTWLKDLGQPEAITEEDEEAVENGASDEAIANAADRVDFSRSVAGDAEVAAWVRDVLDKKEQNKYGPDEDKPPLHNAPLDAAAQSPIASPHLSV